MTIEERITQKQQYREQLVTSYNKLQSDLTRLTQEIIAVDGALSELKSLSEEANPSELTTPA
jgi:prefoldin subunit 5